MPRSGSVPTESHPLCSQAPRGDFFLQETLRFRPHGYVSLLSHLVQNALAGLDRGPKADADTRGAGGMNRVSDDLIRPDLLIEGQRLMLLKVFLS
jgi:hypothetical protein